MNRHCFLFPAGMALAVLFGCSTPGPALSKMAQPPPPPPYQVEAVEVFRGANAKWTVKWEPGNGLVHLTGPGLPVPEHEALGEGPREPAVLASTLNLVVKTWGDTLGLRNLQVEYVSGSRAGNVWFLRGSLSRDGVPVWGRVDCGITKTGKAVLLSSRVPPGAAELGIKSESNPRDAEKKALVAAGLQDKARLDPKKTQLVIWWNEAAPQPEPPKLAYRVFIEPRPGIDKKGGTYVLAADGLKQLDFKSSSRDLCSGARSAGAPALAGDGARASRTSLPAPRAQNPQAIQVRALVRTGTGAAGATSLEPMPFIDVVWQSNGADQTLRTDDNGMLPNIAAKAGDKLKTSLTGQLLGGTMPDVAFQMEVGPGPIAFDIVDPAPPLTQLLDRATVWHWVACAHKEMAAVLGATPQLDSLRKLWCSLGGTCSSEFNPRWLYFSSDAGLCPSWAFDTVILHEWGHALDHAYGEIEDGAVPEAWADIVAMFLTRQPEIGLGCHHAGVPLRRGDYAIPNNGHGHAAEPLIRFAWQVREDLIKMHGPQAGEAQAHSLFFGLVGRDPPTMAAFVEGVLLADDNDDNLTTDSPNYQILKAAAQANGLWN